METPGKENDSSDNTDYPQENNLTGIDILVVYCCIQFNRCPDLFFLIVGLIIPVFFIHIYVCFPSKTQIEIDEDRKVLSIYNRGIVQCCCRFGEKTFNLKNIKKIRLYTTWRHDPKVGFNKLYYMNCDIISLNDESEILFENFEYDEKKYAEFATYFKKHLKIEVESLETAKQAKDFKLLANNDFDQNLNYNIMNSDDYNSPMMNNNDFNTGNEMGFQSPTSDIGGMSMFP